MSLSSLISANQTAFILCRDIGDNVLLAQALSKDCHYHKDIGPLRCAVELDCGKLLILFSWKFLLRH